MLYTVELISTMNNKLSKLEFSSQPTSDFRWESEPSFDNNQFSVELNVKGNSLTEIQNNVEMLYAIIDRAKYEYTENGSSTVELRISISSDAGVIEQIGHLEVVGGAIEGQNIGDVWVLNNQKSIRMTLFTIGSFRRYASKIFNTPEDTSSDVINDINGRSGYKWINNILYNTHFDGGFLTGEIYHDGNDVDWTTYWDLYGTSTVNVAALKSERAMIAPYCVEIDQTGLTGGQTRGFHQLASGVVAPQLMGAVWYTFDEAATGNLVLELNHGGNTETTTVNIANETVNSHPLSNGYKVATVLFDASTVNGTVDYRVMASGSGSGSIYVGGTLLTGRDTYEFDTSVPNFFHDQDFIASGIYNQSTDDYDYWLPYVSQTKIKNRADGFEHTTTSENNVLDRNDVVVWGVQGDVKADTAIAVYHDKTIATPDEEIFMGKFTQRDYWDYRFKPYVSNQNASAGTNWTNGLTTGSPDIGMHNGTYSRLDATGSDGLLILQKSFSTDIPLNLLKNMTFRAIGRMTASTVSNVSSVRLGYSTAIIAGSDPDNVTYNPPADLTFLVDGEIQSGDGGGTGTNHPKYWSLIDLGLVKFDLANVTEFVYGATALSQNISLYIDVEMSTGRFYVDDVFLIPAEEFFYANRGIDGVTGDWDITFSAEKQYSRYNDDERTIKIASQNYDGKTIQLTSWLPNKLYYLQNRDTLLASNIQEYYETNQDSSVILRGTGAGGNIGVGNSGTERPVGDVGGTEHWQANTFTGTGGVPTNIRFRLNNRIGTPSSTLTWQICADGGTAPGSVIDSGTFAGGDAADYNVTPSAATYLVNGTTYWLVLTPTVPQGTDAAWTWRRSTGGGGLMSGGSSWESTNSGASWTNSSTEDFDFTITVSASIYRLAASFATLLSPVTAVVAQPYLLKVGSPTGTITATLQTDSAGSPSGTALKTVTIPESRLSTSYRYVKLPFYDLNLSASTTYWLVLETNRVGSATNYVSWGADASAPTAIGTTKTYNGSWSSSLSSDSIMIISPPKNVHTLEDRMRLWIGFNPKSKFLLARNPDV